jgi:hypothetical protein
MDQKITSDTDSKGQVWLTEVFRQVASSRIITNSHRINKGRMPEVPAKGADSDFFFIEREEPEAISVSLVEMVKTRIPTKFRFHPIGCAGRIFVHNPPSHLQVGQGRADVLAFVSSPAISFLRNAISFSQSCVGSNGPSFCLCQARLKQGQPQRSSVGLYL